MKISMAMISSSNPEGAAPSRGETGMRCKFVRPSLAILCCVLLAFNLPKITEAHSNQNYYPRELTGGGVTRRLAAAPELTESFPASHDTSRTHYQMLGEANNLLDPSDSALLMATDLLNSFQSKRDLEAQQKQVQFQQQPQVAATRQETPPGHYEFEVAPKMEPPSAPKPPFEQAGSACPGSDLFSGFSPKHTLCGDLYQGRVPLNPMGQLVNDQAYPFELIKNKTLQFLARSLPILKGEYETIPKVARYLPANQLLNPTSHQSPLGNAHFHTLNQFEHQSAPEFIASMAQPVAPPFLRTKRSTSQQRQASITVADLTQNATLVVSSAHSSAGRIGHHILSSRSSDSSPSQQFLMITKDGHRSIGPASLPMWVRGQHEDNAEQQPQQPQQHRAQAAAPVAVSNQVANSSNSGKSLSQLNDDHQGQIAPAQQPTIKSHAANQLQHPAEATPLATRDRDHAMQPLPPKQQQQQQTIESRATNSDAAAQHTNNNQRHQLQQAQHLLARSAPQTSAPADSQQDSVQPTNPHRSGATALPRAANKQQAGSGTPLKCSSANGIIMYTVCQAASALIEPAAETQQPSWLQAATRIGNLYAAANADNYPPNQASSPLWALWNALTHGTASEKSSNSPIASASSSSSEAAVATSPDSHEPASQDLTYKSSNGNHHQSKANQGSLSTSPISSVAGVISLLNPLMSFFGPSLQRADDVRGHSRNGNGRPENKSSQHTPLSAGVSGLKTLSNVLLTGLSIAGLYDWLGTSGLFSPTTTSFARRKSEAFVDTPNSLAALASTKQLSAAAAGPANANPIKQPPTPCPSVEEYISPTFARNYQGAWKYVVQIPHEGYFTQTIQRSSCMRQKCEFTDGVCHEAPRWVSLLVAEIFYPNAVFGSTAPQSQMATDRLSMDAGVQANAAMLNQFMATAPSTSQLQAIAMGTGLGNPQQQQQQLLQLQHAKSGVHQDPLQMTDSLNNYNHKFNNAFLNAAADLGLDPTNVAQMQQFADEQNYQFLQRNGLLPGNSNQQQPLQVMPTSQAPAEPRSGGQNIRQQQQPLQYTPRAPAPVQQMQPIIDQTQNQKVFGGDYIKALALETIRRHPHLSIDDLIKSLQMQQVRKKRNVQSSANQKMSSIQSQQFSQKLDSLAQHNINQQAQRVNVNPPSQQNPSSTTTMGENPPSINEIGPEAQNAQQPHLQFESPALSNPLQMSANQYQQAQSQSEGNRQGSFPRSNQLDLQQQTAQMIASQAALTHDATTNNQQPSQHHHHAHNELETSSASSTGGLSNTPGSPQSGDSQVECDGHDKIGCYVVRVYYDWFLVNGSCKCWKTNGTGQQQSSQSSAGGSTSGSAGFIRRIFTG